MVVARSSDGWARKPGFGAFVSRAWAPLVLAGAVAAGLFVGLGYGHRPADGRPAQVELAALGIRAYGGSLEVSPDGGWAALAGAAQAGGSDGIPAYLVVVDVTKAEARVVDEAMSMRVLDVGPDGRQVLYFRSDAQGYGLYLYEPETGPRLVGPRAFRGELSPDRSQLAYSNDEGLWRRDLASAGDAGAPAASGSGEPLLLVAATDTACPLFFPDGSRLFYFADLGVELGGGAGHLQGLASLALGTGEATPLLPGQSGKYRAAEWMVPGELLHVVRGFDDGYYDGILDLGTGLWADLGENAYWQSRNVGVNLTTGALYRSEGARIDIWSLTDVKSQPSGQAGDLRLAKTQAFLPAEAAPCLEPDFSPDGLRMVFLTGVAAGATESAGRQGGSGVWLAGVDGTGAAPLTTEPGAYFAPHWCDGGRRVVCVRENEDQEAVSLLVWTVP